MNHIRTLLNRGLDAITAALAAALPYLELVLPERALAVIRKLLEDEPAEP